MFAERLNGILDKRKMKQVDLCRLSGLSSAQVTYLVNGRTKDPSLTTATKIANALDVSLDYLAGRDGYAPSPLAAGEPCGESLSPDEESLVSTYRSVTSHGKKAMMTNAKAVGEEYRPKSDTPDLAEPLTAKAAS